MSIDHGLIVPIAVACPYGLIEVEYVCELGPRIGVRRRSRSIAGKV